MSAPLPGEPVAAGHAASCLGCGAKASPGLHMRFVDDGRVTRALFAFPRELADADGTVRAGLVLAAMEEALAHAAHARLDGEAEGDGQHALFAKQVPAGVPLVVEAWPGRRSGTGFFFYARILEGAEERAHTETWLRKGAPR